MNSQGQLIESYERLMVLTTDLRDAAIRKDWESLSTIQRQRTELLAEVIKPADSASNPDEATVQARDALIQTILAAEAETRQMVADGLSEMEKNLSDSRQEIKLLREYRRHAG